MPQGLPFGQLGSLWSVLLAWGAPDACRQTEALLKAVAVPVCCALETCTGERPGLLCHLGLESPLPASLHVLRWASFAPPHFCRPLAGAPAGEAEPSAFDQAVLERLADSLLQAPEPGSGPGPAPSAARLPQLRGFLLVSLVRRYLGRSHVPHIAAERTAVNAVRLLGVSGWRPPGVVGWGCLPAVAAAAKRPAVCSAVPHAVPTWHHLCWTRQVLLESLRSGEALREALLPLLWALVDVLHPHGPQARASLATKEAVHRWGRRRAHCRRVSAP